MRKRRGWAGTIHQQKLTTIIWQERAVSEGCGQSVQRCRPAIEPGCPLPLGQPRGSGLYPSAPRRRRPRRHLREGSRCRTRRFTGQPRHLPRAVTEASAFRIEEGSRRDADAPGKRSQEERKVVLCRPLLRIGPNPSTKDAKLIALRVGEYHPRRVTLPDIGPPSTEGKETFDFCGLIDRTEVKMESVLACLLLRNRHEQQARHPIRSRPDLELVRGVAHDNPAQGPGPPSTKRDRIVSVDDDLLPNEIHVAHSARWVSQADPSPDTEATLVDLSRNALAATDPLNRRRKQD
jgi:hypothetical protein